MREVHAVFKSWDDVEEFFRGFDEDPTQGGVTLPRQNWRMGNDRTDISFGQLFEGRIKERLKELFRKVSKGRVAILVNSKQQVKEIVFYSGARNTPVRDLSSHKAVVAAEKASDPILSPLVLVAHHRAGAWGRGVRKSWSVARSTGKGVVDGARKPGAAAGKVMDGAAAVALAPFDLTCWALNQIEKAVEGEDAGGGVHFGKNDGRVDSNRL